MDIVELIKKHEGYRQFPYNCTAGKLTIGYGRNLEEVGLSESESHSLLLNDLNRLKNYFNKIDWYCMLSPQRKAVILDMAYNLGIKGFFKFKKMIDAIINHDFKLAAREMLNSIWAVQVNKRAQELAYIMENDEYMKN